MRNGPAASTEPLDAPDARGPLGADGVIDALTPILAEALGALADAGEAERACRLAGRGYAALRRGHPVQAQRINALTHRLARLSGPIRTEPATGAPDVR